MTVAELEQRMGSGELKEWIEYQRIEPFGQWRDNWNIAQVACILANRYRPKSKAAFSINDFMYEDQETRAARKTKETIQAMKSLAKKK